MGFPSLSVIIPAYQAPNRESVPRPARTSPDRLTIAPRR